ncbi:MAG: RNA repair transcriptional activator RtcR family protein [Sandaracinaceae bacterium]
MEALASLGRPRDGLTCPSIGSSFVQPHSAGLASQLVEDVAEVSPDTEVRLHEVPFDDAWDLEEVYGALHASAWSYPSTRAARTTWSTSRPAPTSRRSACSC